MQLQVTEEKHNLVTWEVHSRVVRFLIGIGAAMIASVGLLLFFPNANLLLWLLLVGVITGGMASAGFLMLATPLEEHGKVERTPEIPGDGEVFRTQRFILTGTRVLFQRSLNKVESFSVQQEQFQESGNRTVTLARLWAFLKPPEAWETPAETSAEVPSVAKGADEEQGVPERALCLTGWLDVEPVETLADAVARVTRRSLVEFSEDRLE